MGFILSGALCVAAVSCGKTDTEQSKKQDNVTVTDAVKLSIDESTVKKYKEKRLGMGPIGFLYMTPV